MKIAKTDLGYFLYLFVFLFYVCISYMLSAYSRDFYIFSENRLRYFFIFQIALFFFFFLIEIFKRKKVKKEIVFLMFIGFLLTASILIDSQNLTTSFINAFFNNVVWVFVFSLFILLSPGVETSFSDHPIFCFTFLLSIFVIFFVFEPSSPRSSLSANSIYYLIVSFVFVLFFPKKIISYLFLGLLGAAIYLSGKQGPAVVLLISGIGFVLSEMSLSQKKTFRQLSKILLIVVFLLACFGILFLTVRPEIFWSFLAKEGSGRDVIYRAVIEGIKSSSFISFLFGHGFNSVMLIAGGYTAHNDFLEIFYDFGLIGFLFYLVLYFYLFTLYRSLFSERSEDASVLLFSICVFLCMSSLSHVIFIAKYWFIFLAIWGTIIGHAKLQFSFLRGFSKKNNEFSIERRRITI